MPPKPKLYLRKSKGQQVAEHKEELVAEGSSETCKFQVMFNLTYLIYLLQEMLFPLVTWRLFFFSPSAGKVDRRKSRRQHASGDIEELVAEGSTERCKFQVMFTLTYLIYLLQEMCFPLVTWRLFFFPLMQVKWTGGN